MSEAKQLRFYSEIEKFDSPKGEGEFPIAWGYASTEAVDSDGDIITKEAVRDAWSDYMNFGNVREMHGKSAAGTVVEYRFTEKGTYVGVKVVDPVAIVKIREGVYKGFSIGAVVLKRDPLDRRRVTKLRLVEISLVDRGANEEARIELFKADGLGEEDEMAEQKQASLKVEVDTSKVEEAVAKIDGASAKADEVVAKTAKIDETIEKLGGLSSVVEAIEKLGGVAGVTALVAAAGKVETLEKALGDAKTAAEALAARVKTLEDQPAQPAGAVTTVEKAVDSQTKPENAVDEDPKDPVQAIKKAMASPKRFA